MLRPPTARFVDDDRSMRILRWAARIVLVAGLVSCVARGADRPADPVLGEPAPPTSAGG